LDTLSDRLEHFETNVDVAALLSMPHRRYGGASSAIRRVSMFTRLFLSAVCAVFCAGALFAQDLSPSRQSTDLPVELHIGFSLVDADQSSGDIGGFGTSFSGRFLLSERLALSARAETAADMESFFDAIVWLLLFGLPDLEEPEDEDHDLMTLAGEVQLNPLGSETAIIALGGLARGDAIGGPVKDTFQNSYVAGIGLDHRFSEDAEIRLRARFVDIENIGPDFRISVVTTQSIYAGAELYWSDPVQSIGGIVGFRF
jgi:hypothetical protein